jgi:hypothetical protein
MAYTGYVQLKPDANLLRLQELSLQLQNLNCQVHVDESRRQLTFELNDDDALWLTTGQITLLLLTYNDIVMQRGQVQQEKSLQA